MRQAITDKCEMYRLLASGALGNTIPQYFDVGVWERSADFRKYATWGVRTLVPGGPCRLYCPREEVATTAKSFGQPVNVSCMIDAVTVVTAWLEIWDGPTGLIVEGIEYPPRGLSWRQGMPGPSRRKRWEGVTARMMLAKHLNANSRDDTDVLLEQYPGHVIEYSACEDCFGTVPGRNAVCWEVRSY